MQTSFLSRQTHHSVGTPASLGSVLWAPLLCLGSFPISATSGGVLGFPKMG